MDNPYKKQLNSLRIKKAVYLILLLSCIVVFMFAGFHICLFIVNMSISFNPKQPVVLHDNNILDFYKLKMFILSFFDHCKNNIENFKEFPLTIAVFVTSFFGFGIFTGEFMKAGTVEELKKLKAEYERKEKEREEKRNEKNEKQKRKTMVESIENNDGGEGTVNGFESFNDVDE